MFCKVGAVESPWCDASVLIRLYGHPWQIYSGFETMSKAEEQKGTNSEVVSDRYLFCLISSMKRGPGGGGGGGAETMDRGEGGKERGRAS